LRIFQSTEPGIIGNAAGKGKRGTKNEQRSNQGTNQPFPPQISPMDAEGGGKRNTLSQRIECEPSTHPEGMRIIQPSVATTKSGLRWVTNPNNPQL
jgi:hypothetical protein